MLLCTHCHKECKNKNSLRNHERLCKNNPVRQSTPFMDNKQLGHKGTNQYIKARNEGLEVPVSKLKGKLGTPHTLDAKKRLSEIAKKRGLGGYQPNAGISKKYKVLDSFGAEVCLQSTYELACSKLLNEMGIKWIRPRALKYSGKNYFADFYLPDFDIYLDPKNNYKARLDEEKIRQVINQNNIKLYVLLDKQINQDYIKFIISQ
jgi:hypothetical protein